MGVKLIWAGVLAVALALLFWLPFNIARNILMGLLSIYLVWMFTTFFAIPYNLARFILRSKRITMWPTVPVTLMSLSLSQEVETDTDWGERTFYEVKAQYAFSINGIPYEGSALAYQYNRSYDLEYHRRIFHQLREAKSLIAHYDPNFPATAYLTHLSCGVENSNSGAAAIMLVFLIVLAPLVAFLFIDIPSS